MSDAGDRDDDVIGTRRLDKWLWYARITKSRTQATSAVVDGKIKVNRIRAEKPSHALKVGDVITSRVHKTVRVLRVIALGERRGPAAEAAKLYEDLTPVEPKAGSEASAGPAPAGSWADREAGAGRPTKRERRETDLLRGRK